MLQQSTTRHVSLEYRPEIDGLRALAVLSVFIFHLNHNWLPGGFVGVDVFFVISGYLITSIIYKECQKNSFSLKKFYQRRISRIFPAFFTVALATILGAFFIYSPQDLASAGANLTAASLSLTNMKLMFQGSYFQISPDAQPFLHYWSLSVEEQFYIFFPLLLLVLFKYARKHIILVLTVLFAASFLTSIIMTYSRPVWAFYFLPTRAWELIAGCLLAVITVNRKPTSEELWPKILSGFSLGLIVISFWFIHEGDNFPGFWAIFPVVGTVCLLIPTRSGVTEKLLSAAPLVAVGQISYSLYLWHWPIFSLVDYKMYLASEPTRLALKVCLSFLAAVLSFRLIENPAREFLNRPKNIKKSYAAIICTIILCVPLGIFIRNSNYISPKISDVNKGGLIFNSEVKTKSVILMGNSQGTMYGKVLKEICTKLGYKLNVISVPNTDPLPNLDEHSGQLWLQSLALVQKEKPDCLIIACAWMDKLNGKKERVAYAVRALKPHVGHLIILNQPPVLPKNANRESMRKGARPPFYEDIEIKRRRINSNDYLTQLNGENCSVFDISSHFQTTQGEITFLDDQGRLLYHDYGHLSGFGAEILRDDLTKFILSKIDPFVTQQHPR